MKLPDDVARCNGSFYTGYMGGEPEGLFLDPECVLCARRTSTPSNPDRCITMKTPKFIKYRCQERIEE